MGKCRKNRGCSEKEGRKEKAVGKILDQIEEKFRVKRKRKKKKLRDKSDEKRSYMKRRDDGRKEEQSRDVQREERKENM